MAGCGEVVGAAVDCVLVLAAHKHPVRRKVSKHIVVVTAVLLLSPSLSLSLSYIHTDFGEATGANQSAHCKNVPSGPTQGPILQADIQRGLGVRGPRYRYRLTLSI
jgi:hypothetical protein